MSKRSLAPLDHISQSQKSTERIDEEQAELMTMREDLMHRPERLRIKHACRKKPRGWNIASWRGELSSESSESHPAPQWALWKFALNPKFPLKSITIYLTTIQSHVAPQDHPRVGRR